MHYLFSFEYPFLSGHTTVPAAVADCCEDWISVLIGFIACVCYNGSWSNHHLTCHRNVHPLA